MLTPPDGLTEGAIASALADGWGLNVAVIGYLPVGFGSHHWSVGDGRGGRWFVTVDELMHKRHSADEPLEVACERLRAALAAARDLRDHGRDFVVAPLPTVAGEPVARVGEEFAVSVYPFIDGQRFGWGEFATPEHRSAVLELVISVHTAPAAASARAMVDDSSVPHRGELEAALAGVDGDGSGPYARRAAGLVRANAGAIGGLLDRYDALVGRACDPPPHAVLTHGEPHPGNTVRAGEAWLLIDWDTALVAPPERDLWLLDPGDGSVLAAYADATGVIAAPEMLELFRLRWDIADLAVDLGRFRRPHTGNTDDEASWEVLRALIGRIPG